jgi:hypothetical protein
MMNRLLSRFSVFDLIIISLIAAVSIAIKPFVALLGGMFTQSVVPIGTLSGIIYMVWLILPSYFTKKRGTAILTGAVQACLALVFGMMGNRGLLNVPVYIMPCIVLEIVMLLFKSYISSKISGFVAGGIANATGAFIVGALFLQLTFIPLMVSVVIAFVSGGIGGVIACKLFCIVERFRDQPEKQNCFTQRH